MFNFKSKKVFEKINKMNRKQAYTIGAIVVVLVVALILLITSLDGTEDDSFVGLNARGYDLAQMPFATDEAEKYLLANVYPDMQENGSSMLYSALEKEQRQEADAENEGEEEEEEDTDYDSSSSDDDTYGAGSSRGYGGYGGSRGGGRGGKTEIGTLSTSGMASAGGSGINSTYGPSGDFRQFKGREDRGNERPLELKTGDAKRALAQFRSGSLASARMNENKMKNAGKALFGGNIQGSDAFNKDGTVDLDKLKSGGFTLDTSAPSTTTDLDNLDKKVAEAAKKAEDKKKEDNKPSFWTDLWQGLVKSVANKLIDTFTSAMGDAIVGARQSYLEGKAFDKGQSTQSFSGMDQGLQNEFTGKSKNELEKAGFSVAYDNDGNIDYSATWNGASTGSREQFTNHSQRHGEIRSGKAADNVRPVQYNDNTTTQQGQGYCTPADAQACKNDNKNAVVKDGHCTCE